MDHELPTDARTLFLVCEDVRQEINNKVSLMGVFIGGDIIITREEATGKPALPICFVFVFRDGAGQFDAKFTVTSPSGKEIATVEMGKVEKKEGAMTLCPKILPFFVEEYGDFEARMLLDGTVYSRQIQIREQSR